MYDRVAKQSDNKKGAILGPIAQKKPDGNQSLVFLDNRPEAVVQSKLPASPSVLAPIQQVSQCQAIINNRSSQQIADQINPVSGHGETLQLKGTHLLTATAMKSRASANLFTSDEYDRVLNETIAYYSAGQTPNNNYGMQLRRLGMIRSAIQAWEATNGALNQAIEKGFFGHSSTDKRRLVLRDLLASIPVEEVLVKQQGKQSANQEQAADRQFLKSSIEAGEKSLDTRLRNSCEWIQTTNKTKIYPVTSTGDSYERLHLAAMNPSRDRAFFPAAMAGAAGDIKSPAVSYNSHDLTNQTNVTLKAGGARTGGWQTDGHVAITNVRLKSQKEVQEVLVHEVQHDADKHNGRDNYRPYRDAGEVLDATGSVLEHNGSMSHPDIHMTQHGIDWAAYGITVLPNGKPRQSTTEDMQRLQQMSQRIRPAKQGIVLAKEKLLASQAERDLERYKTEYRAYSYQEGAGGGTYSALSNSHQNQVFEGKHFSPRQLAIFKHIYAEYPHTESNWDRNPMLADGVTSFRDAVAHYWNPDTEGFNKLNSLRIDDVYNALDGIGVKAVPTQIETYHGVDAAPVEAGNKVADKEDPSVVNLLKLIHKLRVSECEYILNQSHTWPDKLSRHLAGEARIAVDSAMHGKIAYDQRMKHDAHKARTINFWGK
ncbi:hypothetical protein ACFPK9_00860 [Rubritalea spongiae]|uniref:Large polyvalent protein-associated domain-containing protein n=1 Tax=Rubritalea spongiae TaxID=430797 RepID=A0ABW5E547_9BACT